MSNWKGKRYLGEKRGIKKLLRKVWSIWHKNQQECWQDLAGLVFYCFPNKVREISDFPEYQIKFWDQYTLKKADPEMFLFWAMRFYKQASRAWYLWTYAISEKYLSQSVGSSPLSKEYMNLASDNLNQSGIFKTLSTIYSYVDFGPKNSSFRLP